MTDNRKRIQIPKDIQPGDVLVLRDGQRKEADWCSPDYVIVNGTMPGGFYYSGRSWNILEYHEWDVVAIERRRQPKPKPKPVRDDKDAVWLMNKLIPLLGYQIPNRALCRISAIARRLNGGKAVAP